MEVSRAVMDPDKVSYVRVRDADQTSLQLAATRITSFTGEYDFLTTLSKSRVVVPGEGLSENDYVSYPTVEHAFQAAKSKDAEYRKTILACKTPLEAKRLGAKANFNKEEWKEMSLIVMEALIRDKFRRHKALRAQLLATGTKQLMYENDHNDQFWGLCKGKGRNHLGLILEKVRADEKEGLLAILLWAKAICVPIPDKTVCIDLSVTKDGVALPEASISIEKKSIMTFGKLKENDVLINHPSSSRQHALLVITEAYGPLLVDLEAPNGTFIDGRRIEPYKGVKVGPEKVVHFGTSTRRYLFTVDKAYEAKKNLALYEVLEDPSKLAAEKSDLSVFVSNLPKDVTEEVVQSFFADCGTVLEVVVPRHKDTKEPRGFAIVMFGTEASVVSALKLDRDPFHGGNEIRVKRHKAKPREEGTAAVGDGGGRKGEKGGSGRPVAGHYGKDERRKDGPPSSKAHDAYGRNGGGGEGRRSVERRVDMPPRRSSRSRSPPPRRRRDSRSRSRGRGGGGRERGGEGGYDKDRERRRKRDSRSSSPPPRRRHRSKS